MSWRITPLFLENAETKLAILGPRVPGGGFNGELIAVLHAPRHAPLIAAAPAMLAALKVALAEIHNPGAFRSATESDVAQYIQDHVNIAEGR